MNTKITLVELSELIAEATSTSKRVCELFVRELFATVSQALIDGENVKIKGVGTFAVTTVKPRKSVNVTTGDAIQIAGHKKLTFTPDKALARSVNHAFAQFETIILNDDLTDEKLADIDQQFPASSDESAEEKPSVQSSEPIEIPEEKAPVDKPQEATEEQIVKDKEEEPVAPVGLKALEAFGVPVGADSPSEASAPQEPAESHAPQEPEVEVEAEAEEEEPEPTPAEEPEPDDDFYRPAPRNTYTPTQEQISRNKSAKTMRKWWWVVPAVLAVGAIIWMLSGRNGGDTTSDNIASADSVAVVATESVPEEAAAVITDTVTRQIVLSTLADKYYDSPWFWVYIYEENKDKIENPDNVPPGTVVVIPPAEKYGIDAKDPESLKKAQYKSWKLLNGK